jgi:2,3-bisphosphoglycerate-independent phosphoglycerate mutase
MGNTMNDKRKTTLLLILDGWGVAEAGYPADKNAIAVANPPFWGNLWANWPHTLIGCSGNAVGLPKGVMGNSEVGHLNLGAGRVVWQEIAKIDHEIEVDGLASRPELTQAIEKARDNGVCLHLMGLVSDGGVHSMDRHYFALLRLAKKLGMPADRVMFHCFLDGRDTPPRSGKGYVEVLEKTMQEENLGRIAVVSGRYWAMDRDKRWDRVKRAYDAMVRNEADHRATSGVDAVLQGYDRNENDEFVAPTLINDASGQPVGRIRTGDQALFFNFRPDRARQIAHAFVDDTFDGFERDETLKIELTTMTRYESGLKAAVAFPPRDVANTLGDVVSQAGLRQLRIAETEKYAHVTYFFSGGRETEFDGEDRILVPSPKVATYDLQPEMSLPEVSEKLEAAIRSGQYDLIVSNFANGDMVGHTGFLDAAVKAVGAVDAALTRVITAIQDMGGSALITADHGNCENMWNFEENCPHTQHTTTPTPCVVIGTGLQGTALRNEGCLGDVAPTILQLMGLKQPEDMTGQSLLGRD